jgi:hypothetical protein
LIPRGGAITAVLIALVIAACSGPPGGQSTAQAGQQSRAPLVTYPPSFSPDVPDLPSFGDAIETEPPAAGPVQAKAGQTISIECDGDPCLDVVVLKAAFAARYKDPQGYSDDKPDHKGDVFVAVQVRYTATGSNADYNMFDWGLYVDDEQVQNTATVLNGPSPELSANDLPNGKKVTGWIVWEVPAKGRIVLSYEPGGNGSIFEVVIRKA